MIEATPPLEVLQATMEETFCVVPSEYVPVAVNCCVVPLAIWAVVGAMARPVITAEVTWTVPEVPVIPLSVAVMVADPMPPLVALPF